MKEIILTAKISDGEGLKKRLSRIDEKYSALKCYDKASLGETDDTEFVWSTWNMAVFSEIEVKKLFPALKAIFYVGGTVKYFAEPFLKNGIKVYSAASANGIPVAEYTVAQIILANKGFYNAQRQNGGLLWRLAFRQARRNADARPGNFNAKIGLLGCGNVGRNVIRLLKPYRLEIFIYDPFVNEETAKDLGVKKITMEEIFSSCDVISNHLPNLSELNNVISDKLLSTMKPTVTFINTGRGAQMDEKALAKAMGKRPLACALLDVSKKEPPFPWAPLNWYKNIYLTPHIAGSLSNEIDRMAEYMVKAKTDLLEGKENPNEIHIEKQANMA